MEAKQIYFSYGKGSFMEDLSLKIEKGKITTIIGPNGSGKSTLLNLFANQFSLKGGEIILDGRLLSKMKTKEIAKNIAVVYQQNSMPNDITVYDLVSYGRAPYQTFLSSGDEDDDEVVDWALKSTKLIELKDKQVSELSGGERQRAWIALALAQKTEILYLDEPTTYLDIFYQYEILDLVRELNKTLGITLVMVLHDINQAIQYSDNVVIMKNGDIIYSGDVETGITTDMLEDVYGIKAIIRWCEVNKCNYIVPIQNQLTEKRRL
jgi:iron complex transport system ATP-binding protein